MTVCVNEMYTTQRRYTMTKSNRIDANASRGQSLRLVALTLTRPYVENAGQLHLVSAAALSDGSIPGPRMLRPLGC